MRKVKPLPIRDREAGYGPASNVNFDARPGLQLFVIADI